MHEALVDQGFKNAVVDQGASLGIDVEIVKRNPQDQGFVPAAEAVEGRADLRDPDTAPAPVPRLRAPPGLFSLPRLLGDDPRRGPPAHRHEHSHLARCAGGEYVNIQPLLEALDIQEDAARALADDIRTQIGDRSSAAGLGTNDTLAKPS